MSAVTSRWCPAKCPSSSCRASSPSGIWPQSLHRRCNPQLRATAAAAAPTLRAAAAAAAGQPPLSSAGDDSQPLLGVVLVDHGSRKPEANAMLNEFAELYK